MRSSATSASEHLAAQHAHAAVKLVLARLLRGELDRNELALGKLRAAVKVGEEHLLRAGGGLLAQEGESHGLSVVHLDQVRAVGALHDDRRLLHARGGE